LGDVNDKLNFLETQFLAVLRAKLNPLAEESASEQAYLPYLARAFRKDLQFLGDNPKYLVQELTNTLKLYAFAYCSQLALNIKNWHSGEPASRRLYFILDAERASAERALVRNYGYRLFLDASENLFPLLSALEPLQHKDLKRPLWQVYLDSLAYSDQESVLASLNTYIKAFAQTKSRKLDLRASAVSVKDAFEQLIDLSQDQFSDKTSDRAGVNAAYIRELDRQICGDFVQSRGRAGRTLVLNQDYLLLLTNLAIGNSEKLRLHELMSEFQCRGFYLDNQSQQVLVSFYERMGNVERMSDSGDAVYVRKTV
jgi:DNA phosphorothioation-dependent restriction protein DptG